MHDEEQAAADRYLQHSAERTKVACLGEQIQVASSDQIRTKHIWQKSKGKEEDSWSY